ncbi:MAG: AMP-binding protein [Bryobacterales bacterium]|nr:AMP-binding protein [Bryobacterales bacterium]
MHGTDPNEVNHESPADKTSTTTAPLREHLGSYLQQMAADSRNIAYFYPEGLRNKRLSYQQLAHLAWQTAHWMQAQGIQPGDRVLLWGANRGEWAAVFWACLASGIVAVPVDAQASRDYVARIAAETQARLLWLDEVQQLELSEGDPALPDTVRFSQLAERVAALPAAAPPNPRGLRRDTLAQIIFTSGSTAAPKGVCLTHGNTLASVEPIEREMQRYLRWERPFHPIRFLVQLPLSHVFGQMLGLFLPPLLRGEVHFLPELSPADVASTIRERRISVMATVPRYLELLGAETQRGSRVRWGAEGFEQRLAQAGKVHFLKSWWLFRDVHARLGWKFWAFVCGGASLPEDTEVLWRRLGYAVIQGYGMTETASLISVNHPFKMSRGSIGKSMAGREIRISEAGEILVRGQTVSPGYWSKEGGPSPLSEDGEWFATGDLAERDAQGNFYFRGRSKEVIVAANGMNIYPEDLEQALRTQPEIRDAVVVAVEDSAGPLPMALLLPHGPQDVLDAVLHRVNAGMETHQRMARWAVWPEPDFPRTATRKVRRGAVREYAQALLSGQPVDELRASTLEQVLNEAGARWEGDLHEEWQIGQHLALDSLARVQLASALEARFSVSLDESSITEQTTVAELRAMLGQALDVGGAAAAPDTTEQAGTLAVGNPTDASGETARLPASAPASPSIPPSEAQKPRQESGFPFPRWPRFWWASAFRQVFHLLVLRPLTRFYSARAAVVGTEHLDALSGPALFISNHLTEIDGALIVGRLPWRLARRCAIAMSGEILRSYKHPAPTETWYWRLWLPVQYLLVVLCYHVFPLPRTAGVRRAFRHAGHLADEGYHVMVFPEGTRSTTGQLLPFRQGAGILARDLQLPVVPIWLEGVHELREQGRRVARRGEVRIHVGAPLRFELIEDPSVIARQLEEAVRALAAPASKGRS